MKTKRGYLRLLYLVLIVSLLVTSSISPVCAANKNMYWEKEGVTVKVDNGSPTGYTATFVYKNSLASSVSLSGDFYYFRQGSQEKYTPYQWEKDMFPARNPKYVEAMKKIEGTDLWTISLPIPSGSFCYQYVVTDAVNYTTSTIPDPANISPLSNLNRYPKESSVVYGLFDKHKQITDNSIVLPRKDAKVGKISYVKFTDINEDDKYLGVYLPYGYDSSREEPYKVIYLSHGGGGDETEWFSFGNAGNIMDNLIEEGKTEPAIVVVMDNNDYPDPVTRWDFPLIINNLFQRIIPLVENNYNASKEIKDRAFAGLSMGGMTTSHLYVEHPTDFGYFGIFSGTDGSRLYDTLDTYANLDKPTVMLGAGILDMAHSDVTTFRDHLEALGLSNYTYYDANGAHDWFTWSQLLEIFAKDILWK